MLIQGASFCFKISDEYVLNIFCLKLVSIVMSCYGISLANECVALMIFLEVMHLLISLGTGLALGCSTRIIHTNSFLSSWKESFHINTLICKFQPVRLFYMYIRFQTIIKDISDSEHFGQSQPGPSV